MSNNNRNPYEISRALIYASLGLDMREISNRLGIHVKTLQKWRRQFGCASPEQISKFQQLKAQNVLLRKRLKEQSLDHQILRRLTDSSR